MNRVCAGGYILMSHPIQSAVASCHNTVQVQVNLSDVVLWRFEQDMLADAASCRHSLIYSVTFRHVGLDAPLLTFCCPHLTWHTLKSLTHDKRFYFKMTQLATLRTIAWLNSKPLWRVHFDSALMLNESEPHGVWMLRPDILITDLIRRGHAHPNLSGPLQRWRAGRQLVLESRCLSTINTPQSGLISPFWYAAQPLFHTLQCPPASLLRTLTAIMDCHLFF